VGEAGALRAALNDSRAEARLLSHRLEAAERRLTALQAMVSGRRAVAEGDDPVLDAAFEDLWSVTNELEEANAGLAREMDARRAELARIDAALRDSEERVRLAHRFAGAGSWDWDIADGNLTWSPEYRDLLGLESAAIPSVEAWLSGIAAEDRPGVERSLRTLAADERPEFELEYRARHPHRGPLWIACRGRLQRGLDGRPLRVAGLCIDVTARKRAELALRDANENLRREVEREVAAREAVQARVTQTLRMEALGQLTGGVAHDFNNLLAVVLAGASLLGRTEDPARRERLLGNIRQAASRGADLTRRLLTFARRQALRPESVALGPWMRELGTLLARTLRGDIEVRIAVPEEAWPVLADPSEMELALTNLGLNAQDAMPRGGLLRIDVQEVTLERVSDPDGLEGEFLRITVEDDGTGMRPDLLARAFEPFFSTKPGSGSGLGLSQVYGFARQSGGTARIGSREGHGTCVTLLLPRAAAEGRSPELPPPPVEDRPLRVLVVEDDDAVAGLVLDMMRHLGHVPLRATGAADALAQLEAGTGFDLVFTDVLMPGGMDGLDLARELGRTRPSLPVLLTSGYGGAPARVAEAGLPLLRKPYGLPDLRDALLRAGAPAA